ncbi:hypothetical protein E3227_05910 [Corynebacterium sanguinis]|nr:hypothetical protein E3227_05910 [Corynebacterium sanguinis]
MSTPLFARKTTHQLIEEREQVLHAMHPLNLDTLRRLRAVDAIGQDEAELLDRYDSLSWLIDG